MSGLLLDTELNGEQREYVDVISASEKSVLGSVEALKEWMRTREPRQQTSRALRSLGQEWRLDEEVLAQWMETTGRRLDALAAARTELGTLLKVWSLTATQLASDGAAVELREQAASVLGAIQEADAEVGRQVDAVLLSQQHALGLWVALLGPHDLVDLIPDAASLQHLFRLGTLRTRLSAREQLLDHDDFAHGDSGRGRR